ncbi:MAG: hypothetical protein M1816_001487 [Peltula sp. TS41687]|nr:MAG: hypothetical protein M1816_001487 [Peltula sp. TS41687]
MRVFSRLLANVKPAARYLEPGTATGLTGLFTHPTPRSTLLYLYYSTLDKLKELPESSVYRQSTEALTKHRLKIVEGIKPDGHDAWLDRSRKDVEKHPEIFDDKRPTGAEEGQQQQQREQQQPSAVVRGGHTFVAVEMDDPDPSTVEWDGEPDVGSVAEGTRTEEERGQDMAILLGQGPQQRVERQVDWEPEPQLDADQIHELENKIASGLVEEIIQVAEGELKLVDIMAQAKPWEGLIEKPPQGQWAYFERGTFTGKTQSP